MRFHALDTIIIVVKVHSHTIPYIFIHASRNAVFRLAIETFCPLIRRTMIAVRAYFYYNQ